MEWAFLFCREFRHSATLRRCLVTNESLLVPAGIDDLYRIAYRVIAIFELCQEHIYKRKNKIIIIIIASARSRVGRMFSVVAAFLFSSAASRGCLVGNRIRCEMHTTVGRFEGGLVVPSAGVSGGRVRRETLPVWFQSPAFIQGLIIHTAGEAEASGPGSR